MVMVVDDSITPAVLPPKDIHGREGARVAERLAALLKASPPLSLHPRPGMLFAQHTGGFFMPVEHIQPTGLPKPPTYTHVVRGTRSTWPASGPERAGRGHRQG